MENKIWITTDEFDIIPLTKNNLAGGMNVMKNAFFKDENVCIGVELEKEPGGADELIELCSRAARDGVSIVAIEKKTGKIAAASFNKIQVAAEPGEQNYFENFAKNCKFSSSRALVEFMINADSRCDLFKYYNVDCLLEMMFLATLLEYRGKGLATKLTEASILIAKALFRGENVKVPIDEKPLSLKPVPKVVSAIYTSYITQKIGVKMGFNRTAVISYEEYMYKGKSFASRIGPTSPNTTLDSIIL